MNFLFKIIQSGTSNVISLTLGRQRTLPTVTYENNFKGILKWHVLENTKLFSGWRNFQQSEETHPKVAFYKDRVGRVFFRGLITGSNAGPHSKIFNLPVECRPPHQVRLSILRHDLADNNSRAGSGSIIIEKNGEVKALEAESIWTSLDGVTFTTA